MKPETRAKILESIEKAKAVKRFEDKEYDEAMLRPVWNHKAGAWVRPMETLGGFGKEPGSDSRPSFPRDPHYFEESVFEVDESGAGHVRPLPDSEEILPQELYDFKEAERFKYAKSARDTFQSLTEKRTGQVGNPERLNAQWSDAEVLKSQSHEIAARIERASRLDADFHADESLFVPMYRETEYGIYSYYLFSKVRTQAPKFRNSCFLPYMASQSRGKMLKALEFHLERNPFARLWTFTSGERVGLSGIRKRTRWLHSRLRKLNYFLKTLGIEMVFRATEFGTPEGGGNSDGEFERNDAGEVRFHVHAHCMVRFLEDRPMSKERWAATLEQVWEFWGLHWDDGKSVQDVRELCKYVSKPGAILGLADWELLKLYRETNSLHLIQPMGSLREEIRTRKGFKKTEKLDENGRNVWEETGRKMRLEKIDTPDGPVLQEVHDWNCNRDAAKDEKAAAFDKSEKALDKLQAIFDGTAGNAEPEIRILAKCVPGYAPGSLVKEPRLVIMATNWNQGAIDRHPLVMRLIAATWEQWRDGQQLAAAIRVHTGAITVRDRKGQLSWFEVENPPPPTPPTVENYNFETECSPV